MNQSIALQFKVWFADNGPNSTIHAVVKAVGAPKANARVICDAGIPVGRKHASWDIGDDGNPFFSDRGCDDCFDAFST